MPDKDFGKTPVVDKFYVGDEVKHQLKLKLSGSELSLSLGRAYHLIV